MAAAFREEINYATHEMWKLLQLYSIYRFILAATCLILAYQNKMIPIFRQMNSDVVQGNSILFLKTSVCYLAFATFALMLSLTQKPKHVLQTNMGLYADIGFLILMMHACGGILSGMGLLLIIVAAAHSILSPGKLSFLSAALISIGLLGQYFYAALYDSSLFHSSSQAGLLGVIVFMTSVLTNFIALKARKRQSIIHQQAAQLASSYQINSIVVDLMQPGVIVLDNDQSIKTINQSAIRLLNLSKPEPPTCLTDLPVFIQHCVSSWRLSKKSLIPSASYTQSQLRLEFCSLGTAHTLGVLIFIHNIQDEIRKAQDLKLSALGQLTANIAHELRNPLGAVSHAAQLLLESKNLQKDDLTLATMIQNNCARMNQVIKNVLSISCQKSNAKTIELNEWINSNLKHFKFSQFPGAQITFVPHQSPLWITFDPSHLIQVLVNLCENGLRYSEKKSGHPTVRLQTQLNLQENSICLDIIDQGSGIPEERLSFVFEPFYTTEKGGTGLGLYLARELSQINGANLNYYNGPQGSQFSIIFVQETPL